MAGGKIIKNMYSLKKIKSFFRNTSAKILFTPCEHLKLDMSSIKMTNIIWENKLQLTAG